MNKTKKVKSVSKTKPPKKKPILKEAILDISSELAGLRRQKGDLKKEISGIDLGISNSRAMREQLKSDIGRLLDKETKIQSKIDGLTDKLNRIEKIKSEMIGV